jgi:aminopeptidase N
MFQQPLTQQQAQDRFLFFNNPNQTTKYSLYLKLKDGEVFEGRVKILFDLKLVKDGLFLDFAGSSLNTYKINGREVHSEDSFKSLRNDRFLTVPKEFLLEGKNEIEIEYVAEYVNDGNGLHKFKDVDEKVYYYTTMCPFNCNKVFPCFDQPDIKATFDLVIAHRKDHIVISNDNINLTEEGDEFITTFFHTSPIISTYLFAVIAGSFARFDKHNIQVQDSYGNILQRVVGSLFEKRR